MDGHQIPTAPEDITPEWLTRSLLSANTISSAAVASIDINETGDVKGSTGPMARLYLTYDEDAQEEIVPCSLIVKCQHRDSKIRAAFRPGRIYEREVRFYKELAHEAEIGTPKLYYGEVDKESNKYILLLEDLAPARVGDNVAGCSLDEAELAMRQLAGLHASFWESSRLRELSWMPSSSDISAYHLDIHLQHLPAFREKYASRASSYLLDVAEKLGNHLVPIWNQYAQPPLTVVHGDFRLDNLFFGSEEGGKEFAAVDWQMVFRGRGACDVAFFLGSSLDPDTHGAHAESELLNTYHTALLEKGVQGYDFNQFADDYQLSIFHLLTLIHRRTACRRPAEETKGCASESGIMVLKQKTGPRKGAPDRCYHVTTPTASKSPSTTTAWWPMPG